MAGPCKIDEIKYMFLLVVAIVVIVVVVSSVSLQIKCCCCRSRRMYFLKEKPFTGSKTVYNDKIQHNACKSI